MLSKHFKHKTYASMRAGACAPRSAGAGLGAGIALHNRGIDEQESEIVLDPGAAQGMFEDPGLNAMRSRKEVASEHIKLEFFTGLDLCRRVGAGIEQRQGHE